MSPEEFLVWLGGLAFWLGAMFFGAYVYWWKPHGESYRRIVAWWKDPARRLLRRMRAVTPSPIGGIEAGALVAVSGRVVDGGDAEDPWVSGHILLDDGTGRVQVGAGELTQSFRLGEQVFAVGLVHTAEPEAPTGVPYRNRTAAGRKTLVEGEVFFVARGTRDEAVAALAESVEPVHGPPPTFALIGLALMAIGGWLYLRP